MEAEKKNLVDFRFITQKLHLNINGYSVQCVNYVRIGRKNETIEQKIELHGVVYDQAPKPKNKTILKTQD